MAATFVSKKCSIILELYKVVNADANYFWQVEIVPLNNILTFVHISMALLLLIIPTWYQKCTNYQCTNHSIISAFIWNWKNVV